MTETSDIADVQNRRDTRELAINQVGIKELCYPLSLIRKDSSILNTIARYQMTVALPHTVKGTHMSRFVEVLHEHHQQPLAPTGFVHLLRAMLDRLHTNTGQISCQFTYFIEKTSPISAVKSLMDYQVTLSAKTRQGQTPHTQMTVVVPITSLCPCSKAISDHGAHNQRSHVTVTVEATASLWIDDIIATVEQQASCELFGLLKRLDEKYVTETAYHNPKFVEDLVRDLASIFSADKRINSYRVESENFESIHNHSAYAMIES